MASDEITLAAEIRTLTNYERDLISEAELLAVIELAKEELRAEVADYDLSFFDGNVQADRALFWLACIFLKIKTGELDAPSFSVSELRVQQPSMDQQTGIWFQKFHQRLNGISGPAMGHTTVNRDDRTYAFEN